MNTSEGQTQEPVGGMKWEDVQILAKKHAEHIIEMGWRDNPDKDDIIADFISGYASAPPIKTEVEDEVSETTILEFDDKLNDFLITDRQIKIKHSPVGINVEALAKKKYADLFLPPGMTALHDDDGFDDFIRAFKAGYAAQSSTEEEKIKQIKELTENDCGTWFLFYNSHAGWWEKEICHGMDRIYSGWTHFTQLPDTPTNL